MSWTDLKHLFRSRLALAVGRGALVAMLALSVSVDAEAQSRVGTTAGTFLTLGTGARGQALGHAYTTMARGGDALFWNPAGAARPYAARHLGGVFLTHYEWVGGIDYNAAGVVVPIVGSSVLGISVASVDYGRQEVRTPAFPEGTGETFGATDFSIGLTYAQPLTESFYFGGTVKYVRQAIRDMSADAVAFDFGFVLETNYLNGMQLAASIMNFGGKMQMDGVNADVFVDLFPGNSGNNPDIPADLSMERWDLPLSFKFGVALPVVRVNNVELLVLSDAHQSNDNNLNSDVGAQLRYGTNTVNLDLRAGYKDLFLDNVDSHLSYGAGLDVRISQIRLGFDFAYIPFDLLGNTQMVDVRVHF